ncbi:unnamed protein product [Clonostachys rosea]|uniref:Uncharacterized protein n=1 Tax=Bionectria ochroleuca TaxID=29856 RepID=A0ABY6V1C2_BIOOC|nr:unnamed protein product [Clonostachys rosea]
MACACAQERVFLGLDYGATFTLDQQNRVKLLEPDDEEEGMNVVRYTKLEMMLSEPGWFNTAPDFEEIQHWVRDHWRSSGIRVLGAEFFGVALSSLVDMAMDSLGEPDYDKKSIVATVTFPFLSDTTRQAIKLGVACENITSRCEWIRAATESTAALVGLLHMSPEYAWTPLQRQESIIVADCGGLTLDMTVFRCLLPGEDKAAMPVTANCSILGGGAWLDRNYERLIDQKVGQLMASRHDIDPADAKARLIHAWHYNIKTQRFARLGDEISFDVAGSRVIIQRAELDGIFMPECLKIANQILALRDHELGQGEGRQLNRVFITGGLGCSSIVRNLVQRRLGTGLSLEFNESRQNELWNAVAIGGAFFHDGSIPVFRNSEPV